jgi:hypothetical protein
MIVWAFYFACLSKSISFLHHSMVELDGSGVGGSIIFGSLNSSCIME